jgi:hypothetical protein
MADLNYLAFGHQPRYGVPAGTGLPIILSNPVHDAALRNNTKGQRIKRDLAAIGAPGLQLSITRVSRSSGLVP